MKLFRRTPSLAPVLRTARLELRAITPALLEAEHVGMARFAAALGAEVPAAWPPLEWEPHVRAMIALQYAEQPHTVGWHRYVVLQAGERAHPELVGCLGGFPKQPGAVEIGYSILPAFQRQGYASEAVCAFVAWLLSREQVEVVTAQAYISKPESIKVMQRSAMTYAGAGDEAGTARYTRSRFK